MVENIIISQDKSLLDIDKIHHYLSSNAYWALGRTKEIVRISIENSICFGVYYDGTQIGFARVVSDQAVFAWVMDVFVLDDYQTKGVGKLLLGEIFNSDVLRNVKKWGLATKDAHNFYKRFGFNALEKPEMMMEYINK